MSDKTIAGGILTATGIGAPLGAPLLAQGVGEDIERAGQDKNPIVQKPAGDREEELDRIKALARAQQGLSRTFLSQAGRGSTGASGGGTPSGSASASKGTTLG